MKVKLSLNSLDDSPPNHLGGSAAADTMADATVLDHPDPTPAQLTALTATVQDKIAARVATDEAVARALQEIHATTQALQELYAAAVALRGALHAEASSVESKADLGVRAQDTRVGPMPKVQGLKLVPSDYPQAVDWMCMPVPNAKAYLLHICTNDPSAEANWRYADTVAKPSGTLLAVAAGTLWVRVAAKGSDEKPGPPSDAAMAVVR